MSVVYLCGLFGLGGGWESDWRYRYFSLYGNGLLVGGVGE